MLGKNKDIFLYYYILVYFMFLERHSMLGKNNGIFLYYYIPVYFMFLERHSMLGRKKDYWDYIVESLSSTKGLTDGVKYVKSLGEVSS